MGSSAHPWELIRAVCVQLVQAFGDQLLDLGEAENDSRLRSATTYLLAAVRTSNQLAAITGGAVVLSEDATFSSTPPSEELLALLLNATSSSSTAPKSAEQPPSAPPAKSAPPTKAAKGSPAVVVQGPSGRDAVFLLSSSLRECDPLWTDGPEQHFCADLHSLLKKSYPLYSARCSFEKPPHPDLSSGVVPQATVSTLWAPENTPDGFAELQARAGNALDYSRVGLYSHIAVFFLLGDRKPLVAPAVVPAGKGAKVDPAAAAALSAGAPSVEPVLTRVVLSRVDVVHVEKRLRSLRDRFIDADAKKFAKRLLRCHEDFGELAVQLVGLLRTGAVVASDSDSSASFTVTENSAAAGRFLLTLTVPAGRQAASVVQLAVTEQLLQNLAAAFCPDRDLEALADNEVCGFIRTALGYPEKV